MKLDAQRKNQLRKMRDVMNARRKKKLLDDQKPGQPEAHLDLDNNIGTDMKVYLFQPASGQYILKTWSVSYLLCLFSLGNIFA